MTHGLWTLRVKVDGETIVDAEAELGYIHRGGKDCKQEISLKLPHTWIGYVM